jgi:hypothetical protein
MILNRLESLRLYEISLKVISEKKIEKLNKILKNVKEFCK